MNQPETCTECGAAVRPDAVFCIACGHTLRGFSAPTPPPGHSPDPTRMYHPGQAPAPPPGMPPDPTRMYQPGQGPAPPPGMPPDPTRVYQPGQGPAPNWSNPPRAPGHLPAYTGSVKTYLVECIIVAALCCIPLGVIGIVFAVQADGHLKSGNFAMAVDASNKARLFAILGVVLGILSIFVGIGPMLLGMMM